MTHTVKRGETLSRIAKAHRMTPAQLLEANPGFRANPNSIRVGGVLNIPSGEISPAGPIAPPPQPGPLSALGNLSEQFETSGRGPGTVSTGVGDAGGVSYGSYQMTSKPNGGTVARFVMQHDFPFRDTFANLKPGTVEFSAAWRQLGQGRREEFQASQHGFIKKTHFDPLVRKIRTDDALDVLTRSDVLQDVIWSTAVQHGAGTDIPHRAFLAVKVLPDNPDFDRQLIVEIYAERGRKNSKGELVHFARNSAAVQKGVAARFREEQRKALARVAEIQTL